MIKDKLSALPKNMLEYSNLTIAELSSLSGIEVDRLHRILEGNECPNLEDIDTIQEVTGLSDEIIAEIINSK